MRYGGQGLLQPLNDLIDHAPDILAAFEFKPYFRPEITTPDGNIYTLPHFEECYHCSVRQKLWINTTWLDTLGLQMPNTTDDLEAVLLAFKEQDPNGNGEAGRDPLDRRHRHLVRGRLRLPDEPVHLQRRRQLPVHEPQQGSGLQRQQAGVA